MKMQKLQLGIYIVGYKFELTFLILILLSFLVFENLGASPIQNFNPAKLQDQYTSEEPRAEFFQTKEGKISYRVQGRGDKVFILLPGLGDLKENYEPLSKLLSKDGQVYSFDLRGLGGSDVNFISYGPKEVALDILSFIEEKKFQSVYIIANSMTAASAVYIKAKSKKQVSGIIISGPFVRDGDGMSFFMKAMIQVMFRGTWGPSLWSNYYKSLYPEIKPEDLELHAERIKHNLKEEGRMEVVRSMIFASKKECEAELDQVKGGVIVVMGAKDPDFPNPESEAKWIAEKTNGSYFLFERSGHYPYRDEVTRFYQIVKSQWQKK